MPEGELRLTFLRFETLSVICEVVGFLPSFSTLPRYTPTPEQGETHEFHTLW